MRFILVLLFVLSVSIPVWSQTTAPADPWAGVKLSSVTYQKDRAYIDEVVDELAKQVELTIDANENSMMQKLLDKPLNVNVKDQPFWDAVLPLLDQYQLYVNENTPRGRRLQVYQGGVAPGNTPIPTSTGRGLVVRAISLSRQMTLQYGGAALQDRVSLETSNYLDPGLVATMIGQPRIAEAVDDAGNSWKLSDTPDEAPRVVGRRRVYSPRYEGPLASDPGMIFSASIPLQRPANAGTKLSIKYELPARLITQTEQIEFDKLDQPNVTKSAGRTTLTFRSMKAPDANRRGQPAPYVVTVDTRSEAGRIAPMQLQSRARLLDAQGRAYRSQGSVDYAGPDGVYNLRFAPDGEQEIGPPVKFVVAVPTKFRSVNLPVEFKDLPVALP